MIEYSKFDKRNIKSREEKFFEKIDSYKEQYPDHIEEIEIEASLYCTNTFY